LGDKVYTDKLKEEVTSGLHTVFHFIMSKLKSVLLSKVIYSTIPSSMGTYIILGCKRYHLC